MRYRSIHVGRQFAVPEIPPFKIGCRDELVRQICERTDPSGSEAAFGGPSVVWDLEVQVLEHGKVLLVPGHERKALLDRGRRNEGIENAESMGFCVRL